MAYIQSSVQQAMQIFRGSLCNLAPSAKALGLLDAENNGYDDFDDLCESLFRVFVSQTIYWATPAEDRDSFKLPNYGFSLNSYADQSFLQATANEGNAVFAFVKLVGDFNYAELAELDIKFNVLKKHVFRFDELKFELSTISQGNRIIVRSLLIEK